MLYVEILLELPVTHLIALFEPSVVLAVLLHCIVGEMH
jgi:hypothetical protein